MRWIVTMDVNNSLPAKKLLDHHAWLREEINVKSSCRKGFLIIIWKLISFALTARWITETFWKVCSRRYQLYISRGMVNRPMLSVHSCIPDFVENGSNTSFTVFSRRRWWRAFKKKPTNRESAHKNVNCHTNCPTPILSTQFHLQHFPFRDY